LAPLIDVKVENLLEQEKKDPFIRVKLFIAGAFATSFARCLGAPLTRITILQQTQEFRNSNLPLKQRISNIEIVKQIFKTEGLRGFWRGNLTDLVRSIPQGGISYTSYEMFKRYFLTYDHSTHGTYSRMLAGGCAGLVNVFSTYPLEVVRTRLTVQSKGSTEYSGIVGTIGTIYNKEGFKAFYRGCGISMTQSFPMMAMNYSLFDFAKSKFESNGHKGLPYSVLSGVFSGTIASSVLFPMDVVIRNMQLDGEGKVFKGPFDCAKKILVNQGVKGFFRGYIPMLMKAVPICSANLGVYDTLTRIMHVKLS
jgi:solute carrier family 25 (mitochondrial phosphate transporter), member 23/24/25/41